MTGLKSNQVLRTETEKQLTRDAVQAIPQGGKGWMK